MVVDLRRERILDAADVPATLSRLLRGLEQQGNPWGLARAERARWVASLGLPTLAEGESCEVLLWLGCMGSYDERARQTVLALVRLLRSAGVSVATLGAEEGCCGDPARRSGNEYLWHKLAEQNVATLGTRRFTRLVSLCPHCVNTLRNEYVELGLALPAVHATVYLDELLVAGRLRLEAPPQEPLRLTYHDPCYLGRGNGFYAAPRRLLAALPHAQLVELRQHGRAALCCGGGGGQMWLGDEGLAHLEIPRAQEVLRSGSAVCATACPYCTAMLTNGLAEAQPPVAVRDVVELLADCLPQNPAAATRGDIGA
jgi:Fe-S oxidoreductase